MVLASSRWSSGISGFKMVRYGPSWPLMGKRFEFPGFLRWFLVVPDGSMKFVKSQRVLDGENGSRMVECGPIGLWWPLVGRLSGLRGYLWCFLVVQDSPLELVMFWPVLCGERGTGWFRVVQWGPIWSNTVRYGPIWSNTVQYGSVRSNGPLFQSGPIWSNPVQW